MTTHHKRNRKFQGKIPAKVQMKRRAQISLTAEAHLYQPKWQAEAQTTQERKFWGSQGSGPPWFQQHHLFLLSFCHSSWDRKHRSSPQGDCQHCQKNNTMASSGRKITLVSFDGEEFVLDEVVAMQSLMVKNMIDSGCNDGRVPLDLVTARTLVKVIEYLKKHTCEDPESEATKKFDSEFADGLEDNQELLFDVMQAAYDLMIIGLLDLLCNKVAGMLQGKTVEEMRELFHITNDLTPEEEEETRKQFAWAFE